MVNQVKNLTNIKIDLKIFKCKQEPQPMMLCLNYTPLTLGLIDCLLANLRYHSWIQLLDRVYSYHQNWIQGLDPAMVPYNCDTITGPLLKI